MTAMLWPASHLIVQRKQQKTGNLRALLFLLLLLFLD